MKIKFKKDFRKFKENQEINLDFDKYDIICLVGKNGSGKSTVTYAIQTLCGTTRKKNYMSIGGRPEEFKECVSISDNNFKYIDTLCSVRDDPGSYGLSCAADEFFDNGGWETRFSSHGNKLAWMFTKMLKEYMTKDDKSMEMNNLLVIDEIDSGLDINMCFNMGKVGLRNIGNKMRAKILLITHNPMLLLLLGENERTGIFDIEKLEYTTATHYIKQVTNGLKIKIDYPRQEKLL